MHRKQSLPAKSELIRSLEKAKAAGFKGILLPLQALAQHSFAELKKECQLRELELAIEIHWEYADQQSKETLNLLELDGVSFHFVFTGTKNCDWKRLFNLSRKASQVYYTLIPTIGNPCKEFLRNLPDPVRSSLRLHPIPCADKNPQYLTTNEVYLLTCELSSQWSRRIEGPLTGEVWDSRIPAAATIEPDSPLLFEHAILDSDVKLSIVIPTTGDSDFLLNTLEHLLSQTLERSAFEIIVVNDCNRDLMEKRIRNLIAPEAGNLNFKYIHLNRPQEISSLRYYRAGIARNLGVKNATGHWILFLDDDILLDEAYLLRLLDLHQRWDVIQPIRRHLSVKDSYKMMKYAEVDTSRTSIPGEKDYWSLLYQAPDWEDLPNKWRFVSTYTLSLPRSAFYQCGRFRRNFTSWGFEDTDLGYRLYRLGLKFFLNPVDVFHQTPPPSENERWLKRYGSAMGMAKIFYLNNLDPDIFHVMGGYMDEERPLKIMFRRLLQRARAGKVSCEADTESSTTTS